ncbi:hypothetical protein RJ639_018114 [Escallonia herrerae]|uniref:Uncharacterized protein n=1 Tax=Escallonia herrerae TaxID=1293975 RepID=A0AA88V8L3_9ASTE|nr:hypothetical protein RJ639_018114 [Escallonia herrerae]
MQDIVRCIHIGLLCIQELAAYRLSMFDVVLMLNGPALNFPRPLKPAYFKHGSISGELEESDSAGCESLNDQRRWITINPVTGISTSIKSIVITTITTIIIILMLIIHSIVHVRLRQETTMTI